MGSKWRAAESWYSYQVYTRYWQHHHHEMLWMQSHQHADRKFRDSYLTAPWFFPHGLLPWNSVAYEAGQPWNSQDQHVAWQESPYSVSHLKSPGQPLHNSHRTQASTRENEALCEEEELEPDSEDKVERDLSNMDITEELCHTSHRLRDTEARQQPDTERLNNYVNEDHDLYFDHHSSVEPPSGKPGEQRQAEMKHLHGNSASKILAMEAAVQLSFDKL